MVSNVFLIIGCLLIYQEDFTIFVAGRAFYGFAIGLFSFMTPKYISEAAPVEISGTLGGVSQLACTFGILTPMCFNPMYKPGGDNKFFLWLVFTVPLALAAL